MPSDEPVGESSAPVEPEPYLGTVQRYNYGNGALHWNGLLRNWFSILLAVLLIASHVSATLRENALARKPPFMGALLFERFNECPIAAKPARGPQPQTTTPSRIDVTFTKIVPIDGPGMEPERIAAAQYYLPLFVENLFRVTNANDLQYGFSHFVRPFVIPSSDAEKSVADYLQTYKPQDLSQNMIVNVHVEPLGPPKIPNQYHISWSTTALDKATERVLTTRQNGATIKVTWGVPDPIEHTLPNGIVVGGNLPGLGITAIVPDSSVDPMSGGPPR